MRAILKKIFSINGFITVYGEFHSSLEETKGYTQLTLLAKTWEGNIKINNETDLLGPFEIGLFFPGYCGKAYFTERLPTISTIVYGFVGTGPLYHKGELI